MNFSISVKRGLKVSEMFCKRNQTCSNEICEPSIQILFHVIHSKRKMAKDSKTDHEGICDGM